MSEKSNLVAQCPECLKEFLERKFPSDPAIANRQSEISNAHKSLYPTIHKSPDRPDWFTLRGNWTEIAGTAEEWRDILRGMRARQRGSQPGIAVTYIFAGACLRHPSGSLAAGDYCLILEREIHAFATDALQVIARENLTADGHG